MIHSQQRSQVTVSIQQVAAVHIKAMQQSNKDQSGMPRVTTQEHIFKEERQSHIMVPPGAAAPAGSLSCMLAFEVDPGSVGAFVGSRFLGQRSFDFPVCRPLRQTAADIRAAFW